MRRPRPLPGGPPLLNELLEHVLGLMDPRDVARAAAVSRDWVVASRAAMRPALSRRFGAERVAKLLPALGAASSLARLEAHAAEKAGLPQAAGDAEAVQPRGVVNAAVRAVATEWLIEVCWDWKLESTTVFLGVRPAHAFALPHEPFPAPCPARYLDLWLATTRVEQLSKFQGIAISCLRTAFQHSRDARGRRDLSKPAAWAEVCDGAATAADVAAACRAVGRLLRAHPGARAGDTPKLALRRLWYQLLEAGATNAGRVYVYMLASFLLHLSLLDAPLSRETPPTLLATGALACALDAYGFDPWPACLESRSPLLRGEVEAVMARLCAAQARTQARQLRLLWSTGYNYEASHEWTFLRALVAAPADAGGIALERGAGQRPAGAPAAAAAALGAMAVAGGDEMDGVEVEQEQEQQPQQAQAPQPDEAPAPAAPSMAAEAQQEQQSGAASENGEVEQPLLQAQAQSQQQQLLQQQQQQQQQQRSDGASERGGPRRGGRGRRGTAAAADGEETSNQAVVVGAEDEEVDVDSGTSSTRAALAAAAAAQAAPALSAAMAGCEGMRRTRRQQRKAQEREQQQQQLEQQQQEQQQQQQRQQQQQHAPQARQLRQRRARRGAEAEPSRVASQTACVAAAAAAEAAAPTGRDVAIAEHGLRPAVATYMPFAATADAPGAGTYAASAATAAAAASAVAARTCPPSASPRPTPRLPPAGPGTPATAVPVGPGAMQQRRFSPRDETPGLVLVHHPGAAAAAAAAAAASAATTRHGGGAAAGGALEAAGGSAAEICSWLR